MKRKETDCHVNLNKPKKRPRIFSGIIGWIRAYQLPTFMACPAPKAAMPKPMLIIR